MSLPFINSDYLGGLAINSALDDEIAGSIHERTNIRKKLFWDGSGVGVITGYQSWQCSGTERFNVHTFSCLQL